MLFTYVSASQQREEHDECRNSNQQILIEARHDRPEDEDRRQERRNDKNQPLTPDHHAQSSASAQASAIARIHPSTTPTHTAAGIRPRRELRQLRNTFGTVCAAEGVPLRTLQEWMGHESITTTERYASHMPRERDAKIVSAAFAVSARAGSFSADG